MNLTDSGLHSSEECAHFREEVHGGVVSKSH